MQFIIYAILCTVFDIFDHAHIDKRRNFERNGENLCKSIIMSGDVLNGYDIVYWKFVRKV